MLFRTFAAFLFCVSAASTPAFGQEPGSADLSGNWLITADLFGTTIYERMELAQSGKSVTGKFTGDKITSGEAIGATLHLIATSDDGSTSDVNARLEGATVTGTAVETDPKDKDHPRRYTFTAARIVPVQHGAPQRHEFTPTVFYRQFSPHNKPVLTISPGDTVHTTTVDAGGTDEKGVVRVLGGNPETGPFYIEDAVPGDTLVVHSTNFNEDTWLGEFGYVHSDKMEVTEKLTRVGDTIRYDVTVSDPGVLKSPWVKPTVTMRLEKGNEIVEPSPCHLDPLLEGDTPGQFHIQRF